MMATMERAIVGCRHSKIRSFLLLLFLLNLRLLLYIVDVRALKVIPPQVKDITESLRLIIVNPTFRIVKYVIILDHTPHHQLTERNDCEHPTLVKLLI